MKPNLSIVLCLFTIFSFSQKVDVINAPINPIVFKYKKEHFNLKRSVKTFKKYTFDTSGNLIKFSGGKGTTYNYIGNKAIKSSNGSIYQLNSQGYIKSFIDTRFNNITTTNYEYNSDGLLIRSKSDGFEKIYSYDSYNRLVKLTTIDRDVKSRSVETYSYKKRGAILRVFTKNYYSENPEYQDFQNGMKISSGNSEYEFKYKLDIRGNPTFITYFENDIKKSKKSTQLSYYNSNNSAIELEPITVVNGVVSEDDLNKTSSNNRGTIVKRKGLTEIKDNQSIIEVEPVKVEVRSDGSTEMPFAKIEKRLPEKKGKWYANKINGWTGDTTHKYSTIDGEKNGLSCYVNDNELVVYETGFMGVNRGYQIKFGINEIELSKYQSHREKTGQYILFDGNLKLKKAGIYKDKLVNNGSLIIQELDSAISNNAETKKYNDIKCTYNCRDGFTVFENSRTKISRIGFLTSGVLHGIGLEIDGNTGDAVIGEFHYGKSAGLGIILLGEGNFFAGLTKNGKPNGIGFLIDTKTKMIKEGYYNSNFERVRAY